jgi:hypothetical protein
VTRNTQGIVCRWWLIQLSYHLLDTVLISHSSTELQDGASSRELDDANSFTLTLSQDSDDQLPTLETTHYWADPGDFAHEPLEGDKWWYVLNICTTTP